MDKKENELKIDTELMFRLIRETIESLRNMEDYIQHQDNIIERYQESIMEISNLKSSLEKIIDTENLIFKGIVYLIVIMIAAIIIKLTGINSDTLKILLKIIGR